MSSHPPPLLRPRGPLQAKKVLDHGLQGCQVHGAGRHLSAAFWKRLGEALLQKGLLQERLKEQFRYVSLAAPGESFLEASASASHVGPEQPPSLKISCARGSSLVLELQGAKSPSSPTRRQGAAQPGLAPGSPGSPRRGGAGSMGMSGSPGEGASGLRTAAQGLALSNAEAKLLEELKGLRARIAARAGVPPYTVTSEAVLQALARVRPSSVARLRNLEGVNEWLAERHGAELVSAIRDWAQAEGLALDASPGLAGVPRASQGAGAGAGGGRKRDGGEQGLTPAVQAAYEMWAEQGLSWADIANLPTRTRPIQESTVAGYILDAARLGLPIDWKRFLLDSGFNPVVAQALDAAVKAALDELSALGPGVGEGEGGSAAAARLTPQDLKLKQLKERVPDSVSYLHIKAWLALDHLGLSWQQLLNHRPASTSQPLGRRGHEEEWGRGRTEERAAEAKGETGAGAGAVHDEPVLAEHPPNGSWGGAGQQPGRAPGGHAGPQEGRSKRKLPAWMSSPSQGGQPPARAIHTHGGPDPGANTSSQGSAGEGIGRGGRESAEECAQRIVELLGSESQGVSSCPLLPWASSRAMLFCRSLGWNGCTAQYCTEQYKPSGCKVSSCNPFWVLQHL